MELTVNGNQYSVGKLDAKRQFHVARRLAPVLLALGGAAAGIQAMLSGKGDAEALSAMAPMAAVLANMSDADSEYVIDAALSVVQRQSGQGWQRVQVAGGALLFDDIDAFVMTQLTVAALRHNLGNFTAALQAM